MFAIESFLVSSLPYGTVRIKNLLGTKSTISNPCSHKFVQVLHSIEESLTKNVPVFCVQIAGGLSKHINFAVWSCVPVLFNRVCDSTCIKTTYFIITWTGSKLCTTKICHSTWIIGTFFYFIFGRHTRLACSIQSSEGHINGALFLFFNGNIIYSCLIVHIHKRRHSRKIILGV